MSLNEQYSPILKKIKAEPGITDSSGEEEIVCEVDLPSDMSDEECIEDEDLSNSSLLASSSSSEEDDPAIKSPGTSNFTNEKITIPQNNSDWSVIDKNPVLHEFTGKTGLKVNLSVDSSSLDAFTSIFDNALIEKIVMWTNLAQFSAHSVSAQQNNSTINFGFVSQFSNLSQLINLTAEELKKFLGLCLMMGNVHMPDFKAYWSTNIIYYHPLFVKTMNRHRFETIIRCLQFHDESTVDKTNRLYKINQVLKHILDNINKLYYPGKNLSINKSVLLREGRLIRRYYTPLMQVNNGIKIYELFTSDGFILNIIFSYEKSSFNCKNYAASNIYQLVRGYLGKGHTIYMDNCKSVNLAKLLYTDKTHIVSTLDRNRKGNPKFVVNAKLKQGESIFARCGEVLVQKWNDNRDVIMMSTKHKASYKDVRFKSGKMINKPCTVIDYNENTLFVDKAFETISSFSIPRKSKRWHVNLFFYLLDIVVWNSCWLYNQVHMTKLSYIDFRNDLIKQLLNLGTKIEIPAYCSTAGVQHFPKKINKRIRCRVCGIHKRRTATMWACDTCETSAGQPIGLCKDECFNTYHKNIY